MLIKYTRLKKSFNRKEVLNNVHLEVPKGDIFFLEGVDVRARD